MSESPELAHTLGVLVGVLALACSYPSSNLGGATLEVIDRDQRQALTYRVAISHGVHFAAQLDTHFVLRRLNHQPKSMFLGPSDYDITGLAADQSLWVSSMDGTVREFDFQTMREKRRFHIGEAVTSLAISADYFAVGTATGIVCLRRRHDGALLQCVAAHSARVSAIEIADDQLVSVSWSGQLFLWQLPSLRILHREQSNGSINDVAICGDWIASAHSTYPPRQTPRQPRTKTPTSANSITVRNLRQSHIRKILGHENLVTSVEFSEDCGFLVSGSWDRSVRLWRSGAATESHKLADVGFLVHDVVIAGTTVLAALWATEDAHAATLTALLRDRVQESP